MSVQLQGQASQEVQHFQKLLAATAESEIANVAMVWTLQRADTLKNFELELPSPEDLKLAPQQDVASGLGLWTAFGLRGPLNLPIIGRLEDDGAAKLAGLQTGDRVLRVDGKDVVDAQQLRDWIRAEPVTVDGVQSWKIERNGQLLNLQVQPKLSLPQVQGQAADSG